MFRIASYNIRKSIGLDYRRDAARVLGIVAGLGADIVALQEADRRFKTRISSLPHALVASETDFEPLDVGAVPGGIGWHGNALLLRKGTKILHSRRLALPGLEPRGAVSADIILASGPLRVIAVHLGLRRKGRRAQAAHLAAHLVCQPMMPTILLGDFNEWSVSGRKLTALNDLLTLRQPGRSYPTAPCIAARNRPAPPIICQYRWIW